jgi:hypothetical protein
MLTPKTKIKTPTQPAKDFGGVISCGFSIPVPNFLHINAIKDLRLTSPAMLFTVG